MATFSSYILSIAGVIMLSVLVHLILPDGTMSKYIQNIFALIVVFVIISPVATLIKTDFNINKVIEAGGVQIDVNFIVTVNEQTKTQLKFVLENELEKSGFKNVLVTISGNVFKSPFQIEKVQIDLANLVMNAEVKHINKYSKIKEIVLKCVKVKEENIVFYG